MPWYFYLLEFLAGAFLTNSVPHCVHGISGAPFQTPFAKPPGVGESSPRVNVLWGFANLIAGLLLLHFFCPANWGGWVAVTAGALFLAMQLAGHFGTVRAGKHN